MRENLGELPGVVRLAARIGVDEVYLQRMVFWGAGLAVAEQSVYQGYREQAEAIVAEAERRAERLGVRLRGADALSPRASLVDRPPERAALARLQPAIAPGIHHRQRQRPALLHRAVHRCSVSRASGSATI